MSTDAAPRFAQVVLAVKWWGWHHLLRMSGPQQLLFPVEPPKCSAVDFFDTGARGERGAIYTRREVVEFILDLVGYIPSNDLARFRLLEPSCGAGDFLVPAVERLLSSFGNNPVCASDILSAIRAVDVNAAELDVARRAVADLLSEKGVRKQDVSKITDIWFRHEDFLLSNVGEEFTHVVGNPPYIRQESIPAELLSIYRARFTTLFDRADLYVPFFEKSLGLLAKGGVLGFICSDRWMKNRYGGPLRELISREHHLETYVDFTNCPAFHSDVIAYPAVTVISRTKGRKTFAAYRPKVSTESLGLLSAALSSRRPGESVVEMENVTVGDSPWLLEDFERLKVVRSLENRLPCIDEDGCRVGIGVATGADRIYIRPDSELDVEPSRKLPIVTTRDIKSGEVRWRGMVVLNPFRENGKVVDPDQFPKFAAYLNLHRADICRRNVARRNPDAWFRTIDRIYPELLVTPKLLIPDIKGNANIVFEEGRLYPHHNLYYITSDIWDLRALQALLLSRVAHAFIATYSVKMRGDFLRFQAQYLRRIRVPKWSEVSPSLRKRLRNAAIERDIVECDIASQKAYGLNDEEWRALAG